MAPHQNATRVIRRAASVECTDFYYDIYVLGEMREDAPELDLSGARPGFDYSWTNHDDNWAEYGDDGWVDHAHDQVCFHYPDPPALPDDPVDCNMTPWDPSCPYVPPPPPPPPPCETECDIAPPGSGIPPHFIVVVLTADSTDVAFATTVQVTAAIATDDNIYNADRWTWSGTPGLPCTNEHLCTIQVTGSGWFDFFAHKGDLSAVDSVFVNVWGDPRLDDTGLPDAPYPVDGGGTAAFDCRTPANPTGIACPTPAVINASPAVRAAAAALMTLTTNDGKEHGAWLFLNADHSIRVGDYYTGTETSVPQLNIANRPSNAIGSLHTHTDANGPSGNDQAVALYGHIYAVVSTVSYLYIVDLNGTTIYKSRR